ncbi:MAG: TonB-dependent receptor [Sphingomonadaceae bacterium]
MFRQIILSIAVTTGSGLIVNSANAQQVLRSDDEANLDDMPSSNVIIVTAQRRNERLTDVPISMTVLSSDELDRSGISATGDLGKVTPGLTMDRSGPFSQPTIRGIGSSVTGPGIGTSIATYIDGFYQPSTVSNDFQLADVSSVQVLKGPQGTLFGRNSTGGAILVTTMEPTFDVTGSASLSVARFGEVRANAVISSGVTDTIAVYGSAFYRHYSGFSKNVVTDRHDQKGEQIIVRGKILWKPTDNFKATIAYAHGDIDDPFGVAQTAYLGVSAAVGKPGAIIPTGRRQTAATERPFTTINYDSIYLTNELDLGGVTLKSYTGWRDEVSRVRLDSDKSNYPYQTIGFEPRDRTFTQELNLSSNPGAALQWVLGAYYYRDRAAYDNLEVTPEGGAAFKFLDAELATDAYALFADVTYELFESLFLTGGLRYNHEKVTGTFASILDGYIRHPATKSFDNVSPRAVIRYELTPGSNIYASFNMGYKAGTFNSTGLSTSPVNPEKVLAYEAGYKLAEGNTRFEAAGFYYDYSDLQVTSYVNVAGAGSTALLTNAAKARIWGLDASLSLALTGGLAMELGASYVNAKYKEFPGATHYHWDGMGNITVVSDDASGKRMIRTPRFTGRAALDYNTELARGVLQANLSYSYRSGVSFDPFGETPQSGYGLLDARLSWTEPTDHVTFSIFGRNLTNAKYYSVVTLQQESWPANFGEPLSIGGQISVKF